MNDEIYTVPQIKETLYPIFVENRINKAVLFGSYANGTASQKSDIDLMVDNGDIAAVIIEDEATLKRVYYEQFEDYEQNRLTLVAENPKYKPLVYTGETLNHVRILGKAVYFMSVL